MSICRSSNPIAGIASKIFVFASSFTTNFNIEIFIDGVNFSLTSTKVKKIQGDPPLNVAKKFRSEEGCFCHNFKSRVAIFKPHFLRLLWSKCKNFSAHQKENCLRISKLTLLLIVAPFLQELQPLKHGNIFFGTPCRWVNMYVRL